MQSVETNSLKRILITATLISQESPEKSEGFFVPDAIERLVDLVIDWIYFKRRYATYRTRPHVKP